MAVSTDGGRQDALRTVLLVGELRAEHSALRRALLDRVESVRVAETIPAALREARRDGAELVIVLEDVAAPEALSFVREMRSVAPEARVVVVARRATVEAAVEAVRAGARDYVHGPLGQDSLRRLLEDVRQEISQAADGRERFFCQECPRGVPIAGRSPGMVRALETIRLVSESCCNPILLMGETGTGKELAAKAVHAWRCGEQEKFVAVNCAALTASLLESELFGHVKGAFTGSDRDKTGLFELAGSGTIFLDEISEMPLDLQAKLLRVLQDRTFRKVGDTRDLTCNATIVASSNRQLLAEVEAGRFRKDLYYRLAVFPITLPPLRSENRHGDIGLLAEYFIETSAIRSRSQVKGLTPAAGQMLLNHDWPGNVRELRNVIDRALILERSERITPASLILADTERAAAAPSPADKPKEEKDFSLETAEREFILRALKETGWQRTRAANLLGITRATLHAKLKRYEIHAPNSRSVRKAPSGAAGPPEVLAPTTA